MKRSILCIVGVLSQLTYPTGTKVTRGYSDRGQLATLGYNGTTIDTRAYDDGGRMTSSNYNIGVSKSRTYTNDKVEIRQDIGNFGTL